MLIQTVVFHVDRTFLWALPSLMPSFIDLFICLFFICLCIYLFICTGGDPHHWLKVPILSKFLFSYLILYLTK